MTVCGQTLPLRDRIAMIAQALLSSKSDQWATPPELFLRIAKRYGPFDLDVCATAENAKCERFYSPEQDGLQQPWEGRCWMNPPYGRTIGLWVKKAWESSLAGATVVCLVPARTDNPSERPSPLHAGPAAAPVESSLSRW